MQENPGNFGPAISRNLAAARSSEEFIQVLDSDDELCPGSLEKMSNFLSDYPKAAFLTVDFEGLTRDYFKRGLNPPKTITDFRPETGKPIPLLPHVMWRRKYLMAVGGYSALSIAEDTAALMLANLFFPFAYLPEPLYQLNEHPERYTRNHKTGKEMKETRWRFIDEMLHSAEELLKKKE